MLSGQDTRILLRSKSLDFMRKSRPGFPLGSSLSRIEWEGHSVYYRPGTSDTEIIYKVLLKPLAKREYRFPEKIPHPLVLDIGANIGVTTLLLRDCYPTARILAFEPVEENLTVLRANASHLPQVEIYALALGAQDEDRSLYHSDNPTNQGGYSLYEMGSDVLKPKKIRVESARRVLEELRVDRIGLIKIDTEGSEYEILTAMDSQLLRETGWILGELHGERDFELLNYLSQWFYIETSKKLNDRCFHFVARNQKGSMSAT